MLRIGARARTIAKAAAILAAMGSFAVLLGQVEVSDDDVSATRTCGSALDSAIDRSGWDQWWVSDLDEPDPTVRSELVRTRLCPDAVNRRFTLAMALGAITVGAAFLARPWNRSGRTPEEPRSVGVRIARVGTASSWVGLSLSLAGVIAIVVLVGDAESTLFLYTDRLVVAVVGLLVLTPTIALFVMGRMLTILGGHLDGETTETTGHDDA